MWNIFENCRMLCHKTTSTNCKAWNLKDKLSTIQQTKYDTLENNTQLKIKHSTYLEITKHTF